MPCQFPTTDAERSALEVRVIERALAHIRDRWVEKQIVAALDGPGKDPVKAARDAIGLWGSGGLGEADVDSYTKPGYLTVRTSPAGEVIMEISLARVVEYVRGKRSSQLLLF